MKLALGFINYNQASSRYLNYFLPSLKEALSFANLDDSLILSFNNSFEEDGRRSDENLNNLIISQFIADNPELNIEVMEFGSNLGFSVAYNKMIDRAVENECKYFLVINPDTFLAEDSIVEMIKSLESNDDISSVSPKVLVWDFKKNDFLSKIDTLGIAIKDNLNFIDIAQGEDDRDNQVLRNKFKGQIIGPSGAAGMYKLSALKKVSYLKENRNIYFDENFFMYKEDCDLAYRLFLAGFKSDYSLNSLIFHDRSLGNGQLNMLKKIVDRRKKSKRSRSYSFVNQHLIFIKYFNKLSFKAKIKILIKILNLFVFSLIFEQFNLKYYKEIIKKGSIIRKQRIALD